MGASAVTSHHGSQCCPPHTVVASVVTSHHVSVYTQDRRDDVNPLYPINPNLTTVFVRFYSGLGIKCTCHDGRSMACIVSLQPKINGISNPTIGGLLGNWNNDPSDDLTANDGSTTSPDAEDQEIFENFGQKWRVENSMFHYMSGRSHDTYHDEDFVPVFEPPPISDLPPDVAIGLDRICQGNRYCEFDVRVTGRLEYGAATKSAYDMLWNYANDTVKETVCEYLRKPINGTKEFLWPYISHNMIDSKVHFTCDAGFTLVGNYVRRCEEKFEESKYRGRWTGIEQHNDCIDFGCKPLNTLYHGGYEWDYQTTVYPICDPPYLLYGPTHRTCQAGVWTGTRNECYLHMPTAAAIGLGVSLAVIFIVIIVVVIFIMWRKSKRQGESDLKGHHESIPTHDIGKGQVDDEYDDDVNDDVDDDGGSETHKETSA
ncbi:protein mesh-like [Glandiceps talaboti]